MLEVLIYSWHINRPGSRLRFRSLVLAFSVFMPLFYKLLYPFWAEGFFRENAAIFSGLPWLRLRVLGGITLWQVSIIIMGATTLMFVLQERICDDEAVETTGNPLAFASGLIKVYKANLSLQNRRAARPAGGWLHSMASSIENFAQGLRRTEGEETAQGGKA